MRRRLLLMLLAFLCPAATTPAMDQTESDTEVQSAWRLLDYIAVDYSGAVAGGEISSPAEYAEQIEFATTVATKISALPPKPALASLNSRAKELQQAIATRADSGVVAVLAHGLAEALLDAYPVPIAPTNTPDLARGATLFNQYCSSCHGVRGDGHGPAATNLTTPPIAFTDINRARQRSLFALYQVITQGIDGTPMASFAGLPIADRWALAFYTGQFAFDDSLASQGEQLWKTDDAIRSLVPDLKTFVTATPVALEARVPPQTADAAIAYLRRHPEAVAKPASGSLSLARSRLVESISAYKSGQKAQANALALSAYLDGFEPVEPTLGARDATLLEHIERSMGEYRAAIQGGESADALDRRVQVLDTLFDDAEATLAPDAGSTLSTVLGAATILLREGLEALLIVVAMVAFLRKARRSEAMRYVHAGWIGALVAGLMTWGLATWVIGISGASRELTEGFGSVFAALVLLSVGIWMHGKSQADQWQRYIREKMTSALTGRSAWLLCGLAFLVVYREVFETILFYAALWSQGNGGAMVAGAASACVALAFIGWAMLRYSRVLPIGKFFNYSSWLLAILTVVLAGKGIAALQEAGTIDIAPLAAVPRVSLIGLFPTVQTIAAQLLMVAALVIGFQWNRQRAARLPSASR